MRRGCHSGHLPSRLASRNIVLVAMSRSEAMPDGVAMIKLAQAFQGRFEWVLTGREPTCPTAAQGRESPPALQQLVEVGLTLSDELQQALVQLCEAVRAGAHE